MTTIHVAKGAGVQAIEARDGASLMESLRAAGLVAGSCDGSIACATCHVVVEPAWAAKLSPASEDEENTLDDAFGLAETSRLSCQIAVSPDLDGLSVVIPG